ncbi:unnamed protein product [Bathycoccus prasinos]
MGEFYRCLGNGSMEKDDLTRIFPKELSSPKQIRNLIQDENFRVVKENGDGCMKIRDIPHFQSAIERCIDEIRKQCESDDFSIVKSVQAKNQIYFYDVITILRESLEAAWDENPSPEPTIEIDYALEQARKAFNRTASDDNKIESLCDENFQNIVRNNKTLFTHALKDCSPDDGTMNRLAWQRLTACLCWFSFLANIAPECVEYFEETYFPLLRPEGAEADVPELFLEIIAHMDIVTAEEMSDNSKEKFKILCCKTDWDRKSKLKKAKYEIIRPFNYRGLQMPGAVLNVVHCDRNRKKIEKKTEESLRRMGFSGKVSYKTNACYTGALQDYLTQLDDKAKQYLYSKDAPCGKALIAWNELGREATTGTYGIAFERENRVFVVGTNMTSLVRRAEIYFPDGADKPGYSYGELITKGTESDSSDHDEPTKLMIKIGQALDASVRRVPWLEDIDAIKDESERDAFLDMALLVGAMIGNPIWRRDIFWDAFLEDLEGQENRNLTDDEKRYYYKIWKRAQFDTASLQIRYDTREHAINSQAFFRVLSEFDKNIQARKIEESRVLQYEMERVDDVRLQDIPYDKNRLELEIDIAMIKLKEEIALGLWTPESLRKDAFKKSLLARSVRTGDVKEKNANEFNAWHDHRTAWYICYFAFWGTCFNDARSSYRTKVVAERRKYLQRQVNILHMIDGNEEKLKWNVVEDLDKELDKKNEDLRQHGETLKDARKEAKGCRTFEIERVYIPFSKSVDDAKVEMEIVQWHKIKLDELRALLTLNDINIGVEANKEQMGSFLLKEIEKNKVKEFKVKLRGKRLRDAVEEQVPQQVLVEGKLKNVTMCNVAECAEVLRKYGLQSSGNGDQDRARIRKERLWIRDQSERVDKIVARLES